MNINTDKCKSLACLTSLLLAACGGGGGTETAADGGGGVQCAPGTIEKDGVCMPEISACGAGTEQRGNECVPVCAEGKYWDGSACADVPGCAAGTAFDTTSGACVPACADGKAWDGTACVDLPVCGAGSVFDADAGICTYDAGNCGPGTELRDGACVSVLSCGPGTHDEGGVCLPDEPPAPDVSESKDPANPARFEIPASGKSVRLGGTVDTPEDANGDGYTDGNWDAFVVTAPAGTWLRITASSYGAALPVFIVQSADVDANGVPLYVRHALNPVGAAAVREVYIPRAGDYVLMVSDYTNMMIDVFGSGLFPVGGPAFTYTVTVENPGTPQPRAVDTLPLADTGTLADGALVFYTLRGLAARDLLTINSPAKPVADREDDVLPGWMLFDPSGTLEREVVSNAWDKDAAETMVLRTAGDYLLVQDFVLSAGPVDDYALSAVREAVTDCSASSCAAAAIAAGEHVIWSFDLSAGDMFIFGATVPAGATENLRVNFLDDNYGLISEASAGATWSRSDHLLAANDTWVYLYVSGWSGAAVPEYALEYNAFAVPVVPQNGGLDGVAVQALPDAALGDSGFVRFEATAGELAVVTRLVRHDSTGLWTAPAQSFVEKAFTYLGPAVDTTDAALASLEPNMAWIQADGTYLHRAYDSNSAAVGGSTYDVAIVRVAPQDLGTPVAGTPVVATDNALGAETSAAYFQFAGANGTAYDVTVSPKASGIQPSAAAFATGFHYQTTWYSSPNQKELGRLTVANAQNPGAAVTATVTAPYDGKLLIAVTDAGGTAPADLFDVQVAVKN